MAQGLLQDLIAIFLPLQNWRYITYSQWNQFIACSIQFTFP